MSARLDLSGEIYHDIYVMEREYIGFKEAYTTYKCICMLCGNSITVTHSNLKSGNTKSCGSCGKKVLSYRRECEVVERIIKNEKISHLAKEYGVCRSVIYRIKKEYQSEIEKGRQLKDKQKVFASTDKVLSKFVAPKVLVVEPSFGLNAVATINNVEVCSGDGSDFLVNIKKERGSGAYVGLESIFLHDEDYGFFEKKCSEESMRTALIYADELASFGFIKIAIREKWVYFSSGAINTYLTFKKEDEALAAFKSLKKKFNTIGVSENLKERKVW